MRKRFFALTIALAPVACSDGGGSTTTTTTTTSSTTTTSCTLNSVDAGYARIGAPGASISLDATVDDTTGCATIAWTQVSGTSAMINGASTEDPTLTLPSVSDRETLVFEISASGDSNTLMDEVDVEVWVPFDSSSDKTVLGDFSSKSGWQCDADPITDPSVTVTDLGSDTSYSGNGIPAHATGTFPNNGNPNAITVQSIQYFIPNSPTKTAAATDMRDFGVTLEGVKLERETAESYQNAGVWSYEAITPGIAEKLTVN